MKLKEPEIRKWVQEGIDEHAISFAEEYGRYLADNRMTTSQIRNVFGEIRRIQMNGFDKERTNFLLLKPKLAYTAKRHNTPVLINFFEFYKVAASAVSGEEEYGHLVNLLEAILAYHKYAGGKE